MTQQNTIAIVFDFDDTLTPDSTSCFLESIGINPKQFWTRKATRLVNDGWDPVPAYLYLLLETSKTTPISQSTLIAFANKITFYNGVTRIFAKLKTHAKKINSKINIEFYIVSSGIGEIVRNTAISKHFTNIWSCEFAYDKSGQIKFPKNIISLTDKTRYLFHIAKGLVGPEYKGKPFAVNTRIKDEDLHVPFHQMIYIGDGYTDVPCFSMLKKAGGISIGVYDKKNRVKYGKAWGLVTERRVKNLVPADYRKDSALEDTLIMSVESIINNISLNNKTFQR